MKIYVDGSISKLGGAVSVLIFSELGNRKYMETFKSEKFFNDIFFVELYAVICGIDRASHFPRYLEKTLYTDSQDVYNEIMNIQNPRDEDLINEIRDSLKLHKITVVKIMRNKNLAGIKLENRLKKFHNKRKYNRNYRVFHVGKQTFKVKK